MKRKALTLLELIVSVAIMAVLFGLALGAVQKCRTAAERVVCMSNIRQLCLAQHQYMEAKPGGPAALRRGQHERLPLPGEERQD